MLENGSNFNQLHIPWKFYTKRTQIKLESVTMVPSECDCKRIIIPAPVKAHAILSGPWDVELAPECVTVLLCIAREVSIRVLDHTRRKSSG